MKVDKTAKQYNNSAKNTIFNLSSDGRLITSNSKEEHQITSESILILHCNMLYAQTLC